MSDSGISVIVCCYNSASRLPATIEYLAKQNVPQNVKWEIIIVDNASTDNTADVAQDEWKRYDLATDFLIIAQPVPGLTAAREIGMQTAKHNYLLFCDDDNWLSPNYVAIAFQTMEDDRQIGVLGGKGIPMPEPPIPDWFTKRMHHYAVGPQAEFAKQNWVYGAGSVYRKDVLIDLRKKEWKQITTDRIGNLPMYGGDNEMCYMVTLNGYRVAYNEQLEFFHFIPNNRINTNYINRNHAGSVYCGYLLYPYAFCLANKRNREASAWQFTYFTARTFFRQFFLNIAVIIYPGKFDKYSRQLSFIGLGSMIKSLQNTGKLYKQFTHIKYILNKQ